MAAQELKRECIDAKKAARENEVSKEILMTFIDQKFENLKENLPSKQVVYSSNLSSPSENFPLS
jgi:hypothetical protein